MKTTNAQHTPGPWTAFGHPFACTIKAGDDTIAGTTNNRLGEANARLIAAAPDILEALQAAVAAFDFTVSAMSKGQTVSISSLQNCAASARAAIEKATA